jgi:predicted transglutaminase-like cysteine proteinase
MTLFPTPSVQQYRLLLLLIAGVLSLARCQPSFADEFPVSDQILRKIEQEHGSYARERVVIWEKLISSNKNTDNLEKLRVVNDFFNKITFSSDIDLWEKEDYWATPLQMLAANGGDCEDYSIAKYFTLRKMGVPAESMRLTYVKALKLNQAHMVLTYYPVPDAVPLVLDNLVDDIQTASSRKDLLPVYSFNGTDLWLAKKRGGDEHIGRSGRLSRWQEVIARINDEQMPLPR